VLLLDRQNATEQIDVGIGHGLFVEILLRLGGRECQHTN
jgi:hypothetical protein